MRIITCYCVLLVNKYVLLRLFTNNWAKYLDWPHFYRYNLAANTLKKLVLIHDNLPRVKDNIKTWKLTLETSKKYTEGTPYENDDDDEPEEDELLELSEHEEDQEQESESLLSAKD